MPKQVRTELRDRVPQHDLDVVVVRLAERVHDVSVHFCTHAEADPSHGRVLKVATRGTVVLAFASAILAAMAARPHAAAALDSLAWERS